MDFGKKNCVGVQWTTERTRVLSIKGLPAIEVEETELRLPVTAAFHVKVPPQHNGVFEVKFHGETEGTYIIAPHSQLEENSPNIFHYEIAIISDDEVEPFPLKAVTNLDQAKRLMASKDSEKAIYCYNRSQESRELCMNTSQKCEKSLNQLDTNEDS